MTTPSPKIPRSPKRPSTKRRPPRPLTVSFAELVKASGLDPAALIDLPDADPT